MPFSEVADVLFQGGFPILLCVVGGHCAVLPEQAIVLQE